MGKFCKLHVFCSTVFDVFDDRWSLYRNLFRLVGETFGSHLEESISYSSSVV